MGLISKTWETIHHRPGVNGVQTVLWEGPPTVYGEIVKLPELTLLERRIYAIFHFPARHPSVLLLRRESTPVGSDLKDPLSYAKLLVAHEWAEHEAWGEPELLREMWSMPRMTAAERAQYEARLTRKREEAKERAVKLLDERRQKTAVLKGQ